MISFLWNFRRTTVLQITLREGDYFMIGDNIKIEYDRSMGKDSVHVNVHAPRNLKILRGSLYEEELERRIGVGDVLASRIKEDLDARHEKRQPYYANRRKLRTEYEERKKAAQA
jgi:sRNA-binding carbon storage regulator CsrA